MPVPDLDPKILQRAAKILRMISHPARLRIIEELKGGSRSVSELADSLACPQAVVSKHLSVLRKTGLLARETDCNFRHYSLSNTRILKIINCIKQTCEKEI